MLLLKVVGVEASLALAGPCLARQETRVFYSSTTAIISAIFKQSHAARYVATNMNAVTVTADEKDVAEGVDRVAILPIRGWRWMQAAAVRSRLESSGRAGQGRAALSQPVAGQSQASAASHSLAEGRREWPGRLPPLSPLTLSKPRRQQPAHCCIFALHHIHRHELPSAIAGTTLLNTEHLLYNTFSLPFNRDACSLSGSARVTLSRSAALCLVLSALSAGREESHLLPASPPLATCHPTHITHSPSTSLILPHALYKNHSPTRTLLSAARTDRFAAATRCHTRAAYPRPCGPILSLPHTHTTHTSEYL